MSWEYVLTSSTTTLFSHAPLDIAYPAAFSALSKYKHKQMRTIFPVPASHIYVFLPAKEDVCIGNILVSCILIFIVMALV